MPTDPVPPAAKALLTDSEQRNAHALPAELSLARSKASAARKGGLGVARGLVNGLIFTIGLWLAITGFMLLIVH